LRSDLLAGITLGAHFLSLIPYKELPREKVELPNRSKKDAYDDIASIANRRFVPEKYGAAIALNAELVWPLDVLIVSPGAIWVRFTSQARCQRRSQQKCRVANSFPFFWEAAVFALVPLFTLSELREGDRHPKS